MASVYFIDILGIKVIHDQHVRTLFLKIHEVIPYSILIHLFNQVFHSFIDF